MAADWWTACVSVALGVAALGYLWWRHYSTKFGRLGVPYIPPVPVVGNLLDVVLSRTSMPDLVVELYRKLDPHPYAGLFSFAMSLVMIRDPELIRAVTVKDFDHFTDHVDFVNTKNSHPVQQRALFMLKGKEWHDIRVTLSPAFTPAKIKNMFVLIKEIGQQVTEYLRNKTAEHEAQAFTAEKEELLTLEMKDFFTHVTNDVIATTAYGVRVDSLAEPNNEFYTMGRELTNIRSMAVIGFMLFPKLMKLLGIHFINLKTVEFFRSLVSDTMRTREEQGIVRHDMIHLMMQARRGELLSEEEEKIGVSGGKKRCLTDDDIAAQAFVFFFAGFDTVSTLLTFCSYLLAMHEEIQQRLQKEIDDIMTACDGNPSYEKVMGCQYLDMVLSETLRMYAPLSSLDRVCVRPYKLPATDSCPGLELRPGDGIWLPVRGIHYDPKYFPEPERFNPERFSPENKHLIKPFTYYPFGSGPRTCIAQRFALMEAKVLLTYLLSQFSFEVVGRTQVPLQIERKSAMLSVSGGAWLGIRRRNQSVGAPQ